MYKIIGIVVLGVIGSISCYGIKRYPSNRMLDFNWPEPDELIGKFPHEKYCHYYYKREGEELFTIRKCPHGEIFDYHFHECREKETAQCWSNHYGKHALHDHIHSKWRKHFQCPFPNGNYPDIFDCDKYIVCLDGKPHFKHCSPNQQFDKNRRHCVYVAVCANSTDAALVTHMCPYSSGNFAHPEDCSKYYKCHKGEPAVKTCEKNKLFDEELSECKDKEVVHCKDRPNPHESTAASETTVKSVAINDFQPSSSSASISTNTGNAQTQESNEQTVATADVGLSMSSGIIDKFSVTEDKTTAQSTLQSVDSHSSMPSTSTAESTVKSESTDDSNSTMSSSNTSKFTANSDTTDNTPSSKA